MERALALPAPAKINLFLHVLGRRADGYHELQTVFALIDLADWIDLERRDDGQLQRTGDLIGPADTDLALRAARLLQQHTGTRFGADIHVLKRIPAGAGLGGGSSDAATTLIALNRLWNTGLDRTQLAGLALELGADVPFFVNGCNAFAEGRGERLSPIGLPAAHYALIWPQVHVSTKEIFEDPGLTRNTKATKISDFSAAAGLLLHGAGPAQRHRTGSVWVQRSRNCRTAQVSGHRSSRRAPCSLRPDANDRFRIGGLHGRRQRSSGARCRG